LCNKKKKKKKKEKRKSAKWDMKLKLYVLRKRYYGSYAFFTRNDKYGGQAGEIFSLYYDE